MNNCVVWHGHHESRFPLEFLDESFKSRMEMIDEVKAKEETPKEIARRKKLFKRVKGGIKSFPSAFQRVYTRFNSNVDSVSINREIVDMFDKHFDVIMKLHKEQCGCGWKKNKTNIFEYKP